jgi:hypothetical protein
MVKITLELLRELASRNAEAHVKISTSQQRRFHRFAQKAHRARRWIYRSVQQQGLTVARQQMQLLQQNLDGPAEPSSAMAGDARTISSTKISPDPCSGDAIPTRGSKTVD